MGVGLAVITIRPDDHKGILLASEKLGFSEVRGTDNCDIQRGHLRDNNNLLKSGNTRTVMT